MRCASPLGLGGTVLADALRFREGDRGTMRCFLAMVFPLPLGFLAQLPVIGKLLPEAIVKRLPALLRTHTFDHTTLPVGDEGNRACWDLL